MAAMALSALAAAASGSREDNGPDAPRAPRPPLDALRDFDAVALGGPDSVEVRIGAEFAVTVDGDPEAIEKLDIHVDDAVLHVTRRHAPGRPWSFDSDDDGATVRVTMPRLRSATLYGSGDLRVERMEGDRVEASLAGSGDLFIADIAAREARLDLAGSGTLTARGTVEVSRLSVAGSGDIRADRLTALRTRVAIVGSGDAHAHAGEAAKVSIIGSGDATIRGTANCELSRIGSGDVPCSA